MRKIILILLFTLSLSLKAQEESAELPVSLKNAAFNTAEIHKQLVFFSSHAKRDTLLLHINSGSLDTLTCMITLVSHDSKTLITSRFPARLFAERVYNRPQNLPDSISTDSYKESLTKEHIQKFTKESLLKFFSSLISGSTELKSAKEYSEIFHQDIYKRLTKGSKLKAIYIKDFDQGGGTFYGYSPKEKAAVIFMEIPD